MWLVLKLIKKLICWIKDHDLQRKKDFMVYSLGMKHITPDGKMEKVEDSAPMVQIYFECKRCEKVFPEFMHLDGSGMK